MKKKRKTIDIHQYMHEKMVEAGLEEPEPKTGWEFYFNEARKGDKIVTDLGWDLIAIPCALMVIGINFPLWLVFKIMEALRGEKK